MKNLLNYLKDKIYYVMGITIFIIIALIIINSCSNTGNSYEKIEKNMVIAAKKYYSNKKDKLPNDEETTIKVTVGTLIDSELLDTIKDPKNKNQSCEGYVEVSKINKKYVYTPFLTCKGNYEPEYLVDKIKNSKLDEYGNGVYEINEEYIYRGEEVKNYIEFNNQLWRIVKINKNGNIELVYTQKDNALKSAWDSRYNSEIDKDYGITTDYLHSDIRKALNKFYQDKIDEDSKNKMVSENICIGKKAENEPENSDEECSVTQEEKVGLLVISDYKNASLDENCFRYDNGSCINRNYLSTSGINSWLLTTVSDNTYEAYYINEEIKVTKASRVRNIYPVIYLPKSIIVSEGTGTMQKPYKIK